MENQALFKIVTSLFDAFPDAAESMLILFALLKLVIPWDDFNQMSCFASCRVSKKPSSHISAPTKDL